MEPLDYQDFVELTNQVVQAQAEAMLDRMVPVTELSRANDWSVDHPTTRMVFLKQLEMKLIRLAKEVE